MFGKKILEIYPFPKPYCTQIKNTKAIYLGCDPSNKHSTSLQYAFALDSGIRIFNKFIQDHLDNLKQIKLDWNSVYVQNLCQNYFDEETSKNISLWKKVAVWWIPRLKEELSILDKNIPVLLTSAYLYQVLAKDILKNVKPIEYYECEKVIPIKPEDNLLERPLIPFYRNRRKVDYHLLNPRWEEYRNKIIQLVSG